MIQTAEDCGLDVALRVGYTWDFYQDEDDLITDRFYRVMFDEDTQSAWYDYVETIYELTTEHDNCSMAFLTWEDFWTNTYSIPTDSPSHAEETGFQAYLAEKYTIEELNELYQTDWTDFDSICIPATDETLRKEFFSFYDAFLNQILSQSQAVYPDLSMEVRNDWDMYMGVDGEMHPYEHDITYACESSSYTTVMYGIPQGFENVGEEVTAAEALEKTAYILNDLQMKNEGKPVFVDQFIFWDNTPKYSYNAKLERDEINAYLEQVGSILQEHSAGYGVWTYRNYSNNLIYNSQFALDLQGWEYESASVDEIDVSNVVLIEEDGYIMQKIATERDHFPSDVYYFSFSVVALDEDQSVALTVSVGDQTQVVSIDQVGQYEISYLNPEGYDLTITTNGLVVLDNLDLYSRITEGGMYDENNQAQDGIEGVRILNEYLATIDENAITEEEPLEIETVDMVDFSDTTLYLDSLVRGVYVNTGDEATCWTEKVVSFYVDHEVESVTILGYIPEYSEAGIDTNTLTIYLDSQVYQVLEMAETTAFEFTIEIGTSDDEGVHEICLQADYTFVPSELGYNDDSRELAYLIQSIVTEYREDWMAEEEIVCIPSVVDFQQGVSLEVQQMIEGLYTEEGAGIAPWCSDNMTFYVDGDATELLVSGYVPQYYEEDVTSNQLSLFVNGALVEVIAVQSEEVFEFRCELPQNTEEGYVEITMSSQYSYVPQELGINDDIRDIAYILNSIYVS